MSLIRKYLEEKAYKSKMAESDKKDDGMGVDEIDTADYKLDKTGKKHKAHKIVFNKGEDDGKTIGEELKGKQHKLDKNKNGELDAHDFKLIRKEEMSDDQMKKREDLVKGMKKNFKSFVDKYGKDRAENVMYATATKNAMKEEAEDLDEASYTQKIDPKTGKVVNWKHEGDWEKKDKKDPVGKVNQMSDTARRKTADLKEEDLDETMKTTHRNPLVLVKDHNGNIATHANLSVANSIHGSNVKSSDIHSGRSVKSGKHTFTLSKHHVSALKEGVMDTLKKVGKKIGDTLGHGSDEDLLKDLQKKMGVPQTGKPSMAKQNESSESWRKSEEDRIEREARKAVGPKDSSTVDKIRAMMAKEKEKKTSMKEGWDDMIKHNRKMQDNDPKKTSTKTYHDIKKVSTGTVYTKQFDADGTSKGSGDDAAKKAEGAVKRGRGRPKKDKFAEAVEFLMDLTEEQFDTVVEEGLDSFVDSFLDEGYEGKGNHKPGWMLRADPELKKKFDDKKAKYDAMRKALGSSAVKPASNK